MKKIFTCIFLFSSSFILSQESFTRQDTLRGTITPEREWWDLTYYHLDVKVEPEKKFISGSNTIHYRVLENKDRMQIDLQAPLNITKVIQDNKELKFEKEGNAHFIKLKSKQKKGKIKSIEVFYEGNPKVAVRPPWDGGLTWSKDANGNHFIANSNQGIGASIWWPLKDHMYDEVDSMLISANVPKNLMDVSNGRLRKVVEFEDSKTYYWFVSNPINNYGVNINVADYAMFSEVYNGEKGDLDLVYYVLRENLERAKTHFKQVPKMMEAFEYWFGPYPFYEDSFKVVEVPYLGMEHQSSITYGNKYMRGYLGGDLSGTGHGLKFDYIIIHEAGHEWFANSITYKDPADMWIHEGFTAYSENLFLDYYYGKEVSADYVIGTRRGIRNQSPVIGPYGVNKRGSDMYNKGANILHTIRQFCESDEQWRMILRGLNKEFYHQTVTTDQIENYIDEQLDMDLKVFFDQYLRDPRVPTLEYSVHNGILKYKWTNTIDGFHMPLEISAGDNKLKIHPTNKIQELKLNYEDITIDRDYYVFKSKID